MMAKSPVFAKLAQEYDDKMSNVERTLIALHDVAADATKPEDKKLADTKLTAALQSKRLDLFRNLRKNWQSIERLGTGAFPIIRAQESPDGQYTFYGKTPGDMPAFTSEFNKHLPTIAAIAQAPTVRTLANGKRVHSCLSTTQELPSLTLFLREKRNQDDLRGLVLPRLSAGQIVPCTNPLCQDCWDCEPIQQELRTSMSLMSPTSPDETRQGGIKGIITTLAHFAAAQRNRGMTKETQDMAQYGQRCVDNHDGLNTATEVIAHRLRNAYQDDFMISGGASGGRHRDYIIGNGNNTAAY